jgi:hypothetical protein
MVSPCVAQPGMAGTSEAALFRIMHNDFDLHVGFLDKSPAIRKANIRSCAS